MEILTPTYTYEKQLRRVSGAEVIRIILRQESLMKQLRRVSGAEVNGFV